jgi:hypothetical protein
LKGGKIKNKKGRIQIAGFIISSWDIFFVSHDFQPVDMLGIIEADIKGPHNAAKSRARGKT